MSRMRAALLLAIAAGLITGCTSVPRLARPAFDTLPGGIVRVRNSGPSAWTDTNGWKLVLERTIRPEEGSPGALGSGGVIVAAESRQEIYVLDRGPAVIKRFRTDGAFLGTIGRQGSGPGEFGDYGILYLVHDTLAQHDHRLARLSIFTTEGTLVRTIPTVSHIGMTLPADDDGRIPLLITRGTADGREQMGAVRYRLDGGIVDTLWFPPPVAGKEWLVERPNGSAGMPVPFASQQDYQLGPDGVLVWGRQDVGRFVVSRTGSDTARLIEADFPALAISDQERQTTLDTTLAKHTWLTGIARLEDIPTERPRWSALAVDATGHRWVRRSASPGREVWSVFDPEGRWLGDVPVPFGDVASSYWGRERLYILTTDSAGIPQVEIWRIDTSRP